MRDAALFLSLFSAGASPAPVTPQEAALHHHAPTTTAQALHANGGQQHHVDESAAAAAAAGSAGADQAEANCERCGRTHPGDGGDGDGGSDGGLGDEDSDGDVEDGTHISGGAARALAPGPPPGPSGFSSPLARTAVVKQPLGQKVVLAWDFLDERERRFFSEVSGDDGGGGVGIVVGWWYGEVGDDEDAGCWRW